METDATISSHVLHLRRRPPSAPSSPATAAESQPKTTSIPPLRGKKWTTLNMMTVNDQVVLD
uniref:Uncharacterized protein n=1 Tax=Oryza glumipatula TaxID=40148 RepID=A0A0D9YAX9_9ORYZ